MKYTDLREDQKEHFDTVVDYFGEDFPDDATYIGFDLDADVTVVLLKEDCMGNFYWDEITHLWKVDNCPTTNFYQIPDKPWYNPDEVSFKPKSRIDVIGQNGNDGEHYTKPKHLGCFEEVAKVIGEDRAEKELQKVIDCESCHDHDYSFLNGCLSEAFDWELAPQGYEFWSSIELEEMPEEKQPVRVPTGGKSDYYLVEIPIDAPTLEIDREKGVVRFMLEEYIRYGLNNDFDRGNICKANHRLGNKQGVSVEYDTNKIEHYNNRIRKTHKED